MVVPSASPVSTPPKKAAAHKRGATVETPKKKSENSTQSPIQYHTSIKQLRVFTEAKVDAKKGKKMGPHYVASVFFDTLKEGKEKDFSYADLYAISQRIQSKGAPKEIADGIAEGLTFPLDQSGVIPVAIDKDIDAQLLAYHLLKYQYVNSPPTKTTTFKTRETRNNDNKKENEYRLHELEKTKDMLPHLVDAPHWVLPPTPQKGGPVALHNMFSALLDVNRPQPGTLFSKETYKGVFSTSKVVCRRAYELLKKKVGEVPDKSQGGQVKPYLSKAYLQQLDADYEKQGTSFLKKVVGIDILSDETSSLITLDINSISGETVTSELYDDDDDMTLGLEKRERVLTSFGVIAKLTAQKRLFSESKKDKAYYEKFLDRLNRNVNKRHAQLYESYTWLYGQYEKVKKEYRRTHNIKKVSRDDIPLSTAPLINYPNQKWKPETM